MRKSIAIFVLVGMTACVQRGNLPNDEVRTMCEQIAELYPAATLQDVYKTCYQDFFGAEHMISDTAAARAYLRYELNELKSERVNELKSERIKELGMPMHEPTGFRHRYERINLMLVLSGEMTEEELFGLFIDAAGGERMNGWADEWAEIETIALQVHPAWRNEELQAALRQAAADNQAVRHSESFRNTYKPHYRIIRR